MTDGKGYIWPEPPDPEAFRCLTIYVPDHTIYLGAFWNAFKFFGSPLAWKNDAAHTALDIAAIWRVAFEMSRAALDSGEGCETMIILRQNPANDCQLQQSHDGGDTWTLAFDYSICGGPVVIVPPWPDDPTPESTAAGQALTNIYIGLLALNPDCAMLRYEYITAATEYMRQFDASYSNPSALGAIWDEFCALDSPEQEEALGECKYATHHEDLKDCYDGDGLMSDLNCLAEKIGEWLNDTNDALMTALNQAAAALSGSGWQAASGDAGGGGGGGFGAECGWHHDLDFTSDDYDPIPHGTIFFHHGKYTSGVGYQNQGTGDNRFLQFRFAFDGIYEITKMEIEFTSDGGIHNDSEVARINTQHGTWAGSPFSPYGDTTSQHLVHMGGGILSDAHDPLGTSYIEIILFGCIDALCTDAPTLTVTRWQVWGTGPDPFV